MTPNQFFAILIPVILLFLFSLLYVFAHKRRPEDGPPPHDAPRPLTRTCVLIRSAFVYAAALLVLHRAMAIFMILAMEYGRVPGGDIGMGLVVFDPWGILLTLGPVITIGWFTGHQPVSDQMLPAFYILFSAVIDGFFIRLLWRRARHAFVRQPEPAPPAAEGEK